MALSLWLARHGATAWTEKGRLCGWSDVPLSPGGRSQAVDLGLRIAGLEFDGIWTSDLSRASEFSKLAGVEATPDPRLRELDFGELEGMTWPDLGIDVQDELTRFEGFAAPGGESLAELEERVGTFLGELPGGDHLIFTHGGVIRLLGRRRGRALSTDPGQLIILDWEGKMAADAVSMP